MTEERNEWWADSYNTCLYLDIVKRKLNRSYWQEINYTKYSSSFSLFSCWNLPLHDACTWSLEAPHYSVFSVSSLYCDSTSDRCPVTYTIPRLLVLMINSKIFLMESRYHQDTRSVAPFLVHDRVIDVFTYTCRLATVLYFRYLILR